MMAHSQLIHEYVDGSLAPYLEEILFNELSRSESLRHEFRSQLALQQAASADARHIIVPNEARQELFSILGLKPSTPQPLVQQASRAVHLRLHVLTSLLCFSFALGMLGYHVALRPGESNFVYAQQGTRSERTGTSSEQISSITGSSGSGSGSGLGSGSGSDSGSGSGSVNAATEGWSVADARIEKNHPAINRSVARATVRNSAVELITNDNSANEENLQHRDIQPFTAFNSTSFTPDRSETSRTPLQSVAANAAAIAPFFLDQPFRLEMRSTRSLVTAQNSATMLSNTALSFLVELNDDECLGIELNNDTYSMAQTVRVAGVNVVREQNLSRPSVGVAYKRNFQEFEGLHLSSFAQGVCGASISGDVYGRAAVGLDWHPEGQLSLALSLSAATVNYSADNARHFTWTPGVQYTVGFHF